MPRSRSRPLCAVSIPPDPGPRDGERGNSQAEDASQNARWPAEDLASVNLLVPQACVLQRHGHGASAIEPKHVTSVAIQNHMRSSEVVLGKFHDHKHWIVGTITKIEDDGSSNWCDARGLCQQFHRAMGFQ